MATNGTTTDLVGLVERGVPGLHALKAVAKKCVQALERRVRRVASAATERPTDVSVRRNHAYTVRSIVCFRVHGEKSNTMGAQRNGNRGEGAGGGGVKVLRRGERAANVTKSNLFIL